MFYRFIGIALLCASLSFAGPKTGEDSFNKIEYALSANINGIEGTLTFYKVHIHPGIRICGHALLALVDQSYVVGHGLFYLLANHHYSTFSNPSLRADARSFGKTTRKTVGHFLNYAQHDLRSLYPTEKFHLRVVGGRAVGSTVSVIQTPIYYQTDWGEKKAGAGNRYHEVNEPDLSLLELEIEATPVKDGQSFPSPLYFIYDSKGLRMK